MMITCPKCGTTFEPPPIQYNPMGDLETRDDGCASRERRDFEVKEIRVIQEEGKPTRITGYAATFNQPSKPLKAKLDNGDVKRFTETIAPGAFTRSLADGRDLVALVGHQSNEVLARASAGKLKLSQDDKGLAFDLEPADTTRARDLIADIRHGNIRAMSFGFGDAVDAWDRGADGLPRRTLKDVDLKEISFTPFPAYDGTTVALRSIVDAISTLETRDHPGDMNVIAQHCRGMAANCRDMASYMMRTRDLLDQHSGDLSDEESKHVRDMHDAIKELNKRCAEVRSRTSDMLDPDEDPDDDDEAERDDEGEGDDADEPMRHLQRLHQQRAAGGHVDAAEFRAALDAVRETRAGHMTHESDGPSVNEAGEKMAMDLIAAGKVDGGEWSWSDDDQKAAMGNPPDMANYSKWFLSVDKNGDPNAATTYKYPFGKTGMVYRRAVAAIRTRASQQEAPAIYDAAGRIMAAMDAGGEQLKK